MDDKRWGDGPKNSKINTMKEYMEHIENTYLVIVAVSAVCCTTKVGVIVLVCVFVVFNVNSRVEVGVTVLSTVTESR